MTPVEIALRYVHQHTFNPLPKSKGFLNLGRRTWKRGECNSVRTGSEKRQLRALGFSGEVKLTPSVLAEALNSQNPIRRWHSAAVMRMLSLGLELDNGDSGSVPQCHCARFLQGYRD